MASFNKFECFAGDLAKKVHDLQAGGDTVMVYLTNNVPSASADSVLADLPGITEQNGYAPADIQNDWAESDGKGTLTGIDVLWTATGTVGPFQYVILRNETPTSPLKPLIGWWDYGSELTLSSGNEFPVDFGSSILTVE